MYDLDIFFEFSQYFWQFLMESSKDIKRGNRQGGQRIELLE